MTGAAHRRLTQRGCVSVCDFSAYPGTCRRQADNARASFILYLTFLCVPFGAEHCCDSSQRRRNSPRSFFLPACLSNAGDLALVSKLSEADTADTVLTHIRMRTAAELAAGVLSGGILLLFLLLKYHSFLCHNYLSSPSLAKGAPSIVSRSLASASVFAVVTNTMSIPRILSILSYSISGNISCSLRPRA